MRVLVCGSREWTDDWIIDQVLTGIDGNQPVFTETVIIEGGARGADTIAGQWRLGEYDVHHITYRAEWHRYGGSAGPIRNQQMLDEGGPDVVIAFSDDIKSSKGTADMVRRAKKAGVPTYVVSHG